MFALPNLPEHSTLTPATHEGLAPSRSSHSVVPMDAQAAHSSTIAHAGFSGTTESIELTNNTGSAPSNSSFLTPTLPAATGTAEYGASAGCATQAAVVPGGPPAGHLGTVPSSAPASGSRQNHSAPLAAAGVPRGFESPVTGERAVSMGNQPMAPTCAFVNTLPGGAGGRITHADLSVWVQGASKAAEGTPTPHMRPRHPLSLDEQAKVLHLPPMHALFAKLKGKSTTEVADSV